MSRAKILSWGGPGRSSDGSAPAEGPLRAPPQLRILGRWLSVLGVILWGMHTVSGPSSGVRVAVRPREMHLLELLYLRSAWVLEVDVPDVDPRPPRSGFDLPAGDRERVTRHWQERWDLAWGWALRSVPLEAAVTPPVEVAQTLGAAPYWDLEGEFTAPRAGFDAWVERTGPIGSRPLHEIPERRAFDALTEAWERGLRCIFVLPYEGRQVQQQDQRTLTVSTTVREDPSLFRAALESFSRA